MKEAGKQNTRATALSPTGRQIQEALGTFLRREPDTIRPEHHLREDLGLDSLMTFELLYELEKAFDLEIPNEDLPGLQTLADIVRYVDARVPSSMPSAKAAAGDSRSKGKHRKPKTTAASTKTAPVKSKPKAAAKGKKPGTESTTKKRATPAKSQGKRR